MRLWKHIWFKQYERRLFELLDKGVPQAEAEKQATDYADDGAADYADTLYQRYKDEGR